MRKRGILLYLLLYVLSALILTGCAGKNHNGNRDYDNNYHQNNGADFPSILGQASGIPEGACFCGVNGEAVPAWRYLYWLARVCDRLSGEYGGAPDWDFIMDDGRTLNEYAKEQALMDTAMYCVTEILARDCKITWSDQDARAMENQWRERCENRGGENIYLKELSRYGLDRSRLEYLTRIGLFYQKLRDLCRSGSDLIPSPAEAELSAIAREFDSDPNSARINRIFVSSENISRSAARSRAESYFTQLNGAADQAALFDTLARESDDQAGPRDAGDESFPVKLQQVARALRIGQVSGILESDGGFSILIRLPPENSVLRDIWLDRFLENQAESAEILLSEHWRNLNTADFYQAIVSARQ